LQVSIQASEEIKEHWIITIQEEKWAIVHRSIFGKHPSFAQVSSWEEWQKVFDQTEYQRAKNYVIWRLSSQNYHSEQLAKLLKERLVRPQTLKKVIADCQELRCLNDELWIEVFMRTHQKRYSLRLILNKLRMKGLTADTIKKIAEAWQQPEEELNALQLLITTRYRSKNYRDFKDRQKIIAALFRKGFQYDQIQQAFCSLEQKEKEYDN
jgi:regulatory protein